MGLLIVIGRMCICVVDIYGVNMLLVVVVCVLLCVVYCWGGCFFSVCCIVDCCVWLVYDVGLQLFCCEFVFVC